MKTLNLAQAFHLAMTQQSFELVTTEGIHAVVERAGAGFSVQDDTEKKIHVSPNPAGYLVVHGETVATYDPEVLLSEVCIDFFQILETA